MVTCPSCGAILFVDMDGIAHMGQEESASEPEESADVSAPHAPPVHESIFDVPMMDAPAEMPAEPFHFEAPSFDEPAIADSMDFAIPGADFGDPSEPAPLLEPLPDEPEAVIESGGDSGGESGGELNMDSFLGFGEDPSETPPPENEAVSPDDPLGLNEFANSEISQAKDGFLMFRVHISGIDSKEIRESIREAIVDQRFAWDPERIMASISKGALKVDRLSPIKASILVSRLKRLPIQIRWEQYAITQSESPSDDEVTDSF